MNPRPAVKPSSSLALLIGAGSVGPRLMARGLVESNAPTSAPGSSYSPEEVALLDEIGETIIPATDIPGAKAVGIGAFIAMMVTACHRPDDQARFHAGIAELARVYRERYQEEFMNGSSENRTAYLNALDRQHGRGGNKRTKYAPEPDTGDDGPMPHYYKVLKDFTILGYFTSEVGYTQALHFQEVPGRFDPDVPYHPTATTRLVHRVPPGLCSAAGLRNIIQRIECSRGCSSAGD